MRCPLSFLLTLGALSQYGSALAAPPSNTTLSASASPSLGAPLPPSEHPDISVQLRSIERTRYEAGKVIHNCLHVMMAGWMTGQPYTIGLPLQLVDSLKAWSQAVRVAPSTTRTTMLTTQLLAYAAGDIIDDLWSRYSEQAKIFGVGPYRIVDKKGGRAIADWDFVQLPPASDEINSNSSHDLPIQYISSNSSIDDQAAVAVTKRQDTADGGSSSSINTTDTTPDDDHLPLTLPTAPPTADPGILVQFRFLSSQPLAPKSLLVLPAQLLRTTIFRYSPRAKVEESSGFTAGARWTVSRLSYTARHCLRLTILDASIEWHDLASAVLALIPPPTEANEWDGYVAEFTLREREVKFARAEAWDWGKSESEGGNGGCGGGGDGDVDVT
ncbi:MAG: hypothetical protein OHK93_000708 [Ramalina farinacea]|uniref:Uncharacterized protein n=1 Tax=Ramalina farinacea TaxID=258253 RepID=A0AA43QJP5_9LECA|nr:hypothetical protein [Ramalina farinacea]